MKFLHTADLHLGRVLHERSLVDDQRAMLGQLLDALGADDYAALLIAGDVYDRSIPSPEAVELLGTFLSELRRRFPRLVVVAVCGNHDSPERLGYGDRLFSALGIHIVTDPASSFRPIMIEQGGERCAVFALPFLSPGSLRKGDGEDGEPLRSQKDLAREAAERLERARSSAIADGAATTVLVAHLFATGGAESESERVFLGTTERVDVSLFGSFDYVALGHLHRRQRASDKAYYSGSPLAYSFDEAAGADKAFLAVEVLAGREPVASTVPVRPSRRVLRLRGPFSSFLSSGAHEDVREDYLEIALTDPGLTENPLAVLRSRFPNLLSVRQDEALAAAGVDAGASASILPSARRDIAGDFGEFLRDLYGEEDGEKIELFRAVAAEATDASA